MENFLTKKNQVLFIITLLLAAILAPKLLSIKPDFSYAAWFRSEDPNLKNFRVYEKEFGNEDSIAVALYNKKGIITKEGIELIKDLTEKFYYVHNTYKVDSLSNYSKIESTDQDLSLRSIIPEDIEEINSSQLEKIRLEIKKEKFLNNYLLNKERTLTMFYLKMKPVFEAKENYTIAYQEVNKILKETDLGETEFYITGGAATIQEISKQVRSDVSLIGPMLFLLVLVITWLMFKSFYLTIIPLITILLTLIITFGFSGFTTITFNPITSMAPHILIAICIADTIHLISGFNTNRNQKPDASREDIVRLTIKQKVMPTLYTSITTALGFFALTFTEIKPIHDLGIVASIGTMIAWGVCYFITPFFLLRNKNLKLQKEKIKIKFSEGYIQGIKKYKLAIFLAFFSVAIYGIIKLPSIPVNSRTTKMLALDNPVRVSAKFIKDNMGGFVGVDVLIHANGGDFNSLLKHTKVMQKWVDEQPWSTKTTSIIDFLSEANKAFSKNGDLLNNTTEQNKQLLLLYNISSSDSQEVKWLSTSQESSRIKVSWITSGSDEAKRIIKEINDYAKSVNIKAEVNGKTNLLKDLNTYLVDVFSRSILFSIVFVFFFMLVYLRSFKLTVISMIPNVVPILMGIAAMALLKMEIDFASVMVASVCIGIVIDDTIHFMHALRDSKGETRHEQVKEVLNSTGTALIHTSIILVLSFIIFLFGNVSLNINFGILTIIIITVALLCDIVLLPAILLRRKEAA